jgi:2-polyprenyl-3-methyl-5-hydroxy-6-metoxy-1,4-benzoquinol methylase
MSGVSAEFRKTNSDRIDMSNTEEVFCPLCNCDSSQKKHLVGLWFIVKCRNCCFVFVNPRLQKKELFNIYSSNYFNSREIGYHDYNKNRALRKKNFRKWINDALIYLSQKENVRALDVGCATGYCLEIFHEKKWHPFGIELDKTLAQNLRGRGFNIDDAPLLQTTLKGKFSVITLFDVVEHLTDLQENFKVLNDILENNGIIIIVTPNYNSFQRKLFGNKWFQFKPLEHINYFTFNTLKKLATAAGFEVVAKKNSGQYADIDFLLNRLFKYGLKSIAPIIRFVFRFFNLNNKNFYVDTASLYVILRKKMVHEVA